MLDDHCQQDDFWLFHIVCLLRSDSGSFVCDCLSFYEFDTFVSLFSEFIYNMISMFSTLILCVKHQFYSFQIWMHSNQVCQLMAYLYLMLTISKHTNCLCNGYQMSVHCMLSEIVYCHLRKSVLKRWTCCNDFMTVYWFVSNEISFRNFEINFQLKNCASVNVFSAITYTNTIFNNTVFLFGLF